MRTLINLFVVLTASFTFISAASAETSDKMRIVNVDASKYHNEYDKAMASDPWHGFNFAMFRFNSGLDKYFIAPLARGYRFAIPQWGRTRVSNFFNNVNEPRNFANSALQGDMQGILHSVWRFGINATFGIGGLFDVASAFGVNDKDKDFSQTLAYYGLGSGPYLVLPFIGPSTPRDVTGIVADQFTDPTTYLDDPYQYVASGVNIVQTRESILDYTDDAEANSFDLYSTYKSAYLQNRKKRVLDTLE